MAGIPLPVVKNLANLFRLHNDRLVWLQMNFVFVLLAGFVIIDQDLFVVPERSGNFII